MTQFRTAGRLSAVAAAALMIATSAPAFATDPTTDTSAPRADQRVCVQEAVTGSRVPRRVCKTRAQWIREDGRDPSQASR